jgi:outer membrane protein OmpA-like peptidoglycan-associated protein
MKKPLFYLLIFFPAMLWAQSAGSADELEKLLNSPRVSCALAARLVLEAADEGFFPNPADAFAFARDRGWLPKAVEPDDPIRFNAVSQLVMSSFRIKGGLLYSIFKTPHFAYRELSYRSVIQGKTDPEMTVSGKQLLHIIAQVLPLNEEIPAPAPVITASTGEPDTEDSAAEQARIAAKQARIAAEQARIAAEQVRAAEQARIAAEQAQNAEQARIAAEQARNVEQARIAAEQAETAEQARIAAEQARTAEQAQIAAEQARNAEQARIAAEQARNAGIVGVTPAGAIIQFPNYEDQTKIVETILFLGDVARILPQDRSKLDRVGKLLTQDADSSVLIIGHTALFGPTRGDVNLSLRRATLVSDYLITHWSIPAERIRIWGYGSQKAVAVNNSKAGRQLNRRVEVRVWKE